MPEQLSLIPGPVCDSDQSSPPNIYAHIVRAREIISRPPRSAFEKDLEEYYSSWGDPMAEWLLRQDGCGGDASRDIANTPPVSEEEQERLRSTRRAIAKAGVELCRKTLRRSNPNWRAIDNEALAEHRRANSAA